VEVKVIEALKRVQPTLSVKREEKTDRKEVGRKPWVRCFSREPEKKKWDQPGGKKRKQPWQLERG